MRYAALIVIAAALITGSAWVYAQQDRQVQVVPVPQENILSGADIGFRVDDVVGGKAFGRLVVRMKDGSWVEAHGRGGVQPLHGR